MPFGLPQQQTNAMGQVAQQGRNAMGMGAVQRPMLSGAVRKSGPNQARMDPMAGQLQTAMMARNMGQPVGMPPPPNPGIGPSAPPVNTALSSYQPDQNQMIGALGGGQNEQLPAMKDPNAGGDPSMDQARQNFMNQLKMMYGGQGMMGQGGGNPNANAWGNAASGMMGGGMKTPGNPMMARGGMGLGPSFMGNAQPIQQMGQAQPANQPAPMTQSRRFGGGMMGQ